MNGHADHRKRLDLASEEDKDSGSRKALLISLVALAIPVVGSAVVPEWASGDLGLLLWILPIVPAFLLSYHHGWRGASAALAAGMAALALGQSLLAWSRATTPPSGLVLGFIVVLLLVSLGSGWIAESFRASLQQARDAALTDPGTGLPNRRAASAFVERAFYAAERGSQLSVVLLDIDHFKSVNDEHGHAIGDQVLRALGDILKAMTRAMNLSARYGGEEFLCVLNDTDADGAAIFANRIRQTFEQAELPGGKVTLSAGVAQYEPGMAAPDVLVAAADQALYRAKLSGRNRVEVLGRMGRRPVRLTEPASTPTSLPHGHGQRILVVDDDQAARRGIARALQRIGYSVLEAESAQRALHILQGLGDPLDLVVSDIVMPDITGFRLIEMMQEIQPSIRAVYVSGYSQDDVDWGGVPGTVWAFVSKPISLDELARVVSDLLTRPLKEEGDTDPPTTPAPSYGHEHNAGIPLLRPVLDELDSAIMHKRIAVVHPERAASSILVSILRKSGFQEVHGFRNLAEIRGCDPCDLLVVDLTATNVFGDLALELSHDPTETSHPPVLCLAGGDSQHLRMELLAQGLVEVLQRPVDGLLLASTARNLLRIRQLCADIGAHEQTRDAALAAQAAELQESRAEILRRLARAAEHHDEPTADHAERVGRIAGVIAAELGWSRERCSLIEEAAILHDVGKIAVPDAVLRKPGQLTPAERLIMQQHTVTGAQILSGSRNPVLIMAEEIALAHHERWDGAGYPKGLRDTQIPESARIVAVADSFDTMIHLRPYRNPLDEDQAVRNLAEGAGTHYDLGVVKAFLRVRAGGELREVMSGSLVALPDPHATTTS